MTLDNGRWVMVEFVDGPHDGRTVAIDGSTVVDLTTGLVDLVGAAPGYRPIRAPAAGDSLDLWADRERSAIASFDRGSPELYIQMTWRPDHGRPGRPAGGGRALRPATGDRGVDSLVAALVQGREDRVRSIVGRAVAGGTVTALIETMLAPAMATIGERWAIGAVEVHVEHRATSIVSRLLAEHAPDRGHGRRGRAVVTSLAGERHSLPTEMAAMALGEAGWTVDHLGADLPAADLLDEPSAVHGVDLLVLSVTMESNRRDSIETAALLRQRGLPVLVGGPGQPVGGLQRAARAVACG